MFPRQTLGSQDGGCRERPRGLPPERPTYGADAMREKTAIAVIVALAMVVPVAGCGGGSTSTTTTSQPKETAQKLPKLPPGWKARRDQTIGYAIGLPTDWEVQGHGDRSVLFRS